MDPATKLSRRQMFGVLASSAMSHAAATAARPNVLFIYTDDHSHRTLSCYKEAYPWVKTPNIDRLAKQGVRFLAAYNGSWCMPSRSTMLTGRHTTGIESMRMEGPYPQCVYDAEKCPFWPKIFRQKGYFTGQIGKWHTGTDTGFGRDWDYQIVWNRPKYTETSQNYYYDQPITYHGGKTEILKRYSTDQYTDWAIEFLKGDGRDKSKPGTCGSAMERSIVLISRPSGTWMNSPALTSKHRKIFIRRVPPSRTGHRRSTNGRRGPMGRRYLGTRR